MNIENFSTASTFQSRVQPWMMACFGPEISADKLERGDRFLEEALELVQSGNYPKERVYSLVEYVYGRDQGEINQEVGGVMVTLAAYCLAHDLDMHEAGETELTRIWTKVEKIRAKQAAKPTGSALPIAAPASAAEPTDEKEALEAASNGKPHPICIWHAGDAIAYYKATEADREAWNAYAQREADKFNSDPSLDSYDSISTHIGMDRDGKITDWCPPLFFPEWLAQHKV